MKNRKPYAGGAVLCHVSSSEARSLSLLLCRGSTHSDFTSVTSSDRAVLPAPAAVRSNIHSVRCSLLKADTSLSVASSYPHPAFLPLRFYSPLLFHLCLPTHQPPPHRHMPTQLFLPLATCCSSVMASCCAIFYSSRVFLLSSLSKLLPFWKVYV